LQELKNDMIKTMRNITITALFLIGSLSAYSQDNTNSESNHPVKWLTFPEAEKMFIANPRPFFIDTYTDWCGWCKKMDQETFTNSVIADLLNNRFYPVKFNAEGKDEVTFLGNKFINDGKSGNAHQLAVVLLQGQLSYPTVVFMTKDNDKYSISPVPGFRQPKDMEVILSYFADKAYQTQEWQAYQKNFKGKVK
jgi:thioredoxin-related protein